MHPSSHKIKKRKQQQQQVLTAQSTSNTMKTISAILVTVALLFLTSSSTVEAGLRGGASTNANDNQVKEHRQLFGAGSGLDISCFWCDFDSKKCPSRCNRRRDLMEKESIEEPESSIEDEPESELSNNANEEHRELHMFVTKGEYWRCIDCLCTFLGCKCPAGCNGK